MASQHITTSPLLKRVVNLTLAQLCYTTSPGTMVASQTPQLISLISLAVTTIPTEETGAAGDPAQANHWPAHNHMPAGPDGHESNTDFVPATTKGTQGVGTGHHITKALLKKGRTAASIQLRYTTSLWPQPDTATD